MSRIGRRVPEVLRRPEQGWSSLLLLLGLLTVVGISLADSRLIDIGEQDRTGSLLVVLLAGGLIGFLLARSSIGVVRAHLIGAGAAAFVLLMIVAAAVQQSGTLLPAGWAELQLWVSELGVKLDAGIAEFVEDGTAQPPPEATFLVLGAICWTTAQFSAFSIFRYGRGGPAVMATGVMLFLNVALHALEPAPDRLPVWPMLAIFSALAMLLLMRMQLTQQGYQWARRHIADTGEVSRLFLRTGTLFVALTVLGASSMTLVAMAPPQDVKVGDLEARFEAVGQQIARWLEFIAVPVESPDQSALGGRLDVPLEWTPGAGIAFTATSDDPLRGNYWWAVAYREFNGRSWAPPDELDSVDYSTGTQLLTPADAGAGPRYPFSATITTGEDRTTWKAVFRPAEAAEIGRDATAFVIDGGRGLGRIAFEQALKEDQSYTLESSVRDYGGGTESLTEYDLQTAGDGYPDWVTERYLQGAYDIRITGPLARAMADKIDQDYDNAYDKVSKVQRYLRDLEYDTNMGVCASELTAECLLREGRGFCTYFASTMIVVLRDMDIPARMIYGYLPGKLSSGVWEVERQALHNWVEVYFPTYGWIRFDPTPGERLERYGQGPTDFDKGAPPTSGPEVSPLPTPDSVPSGLIEESTTAPDDLVPGGDGEGDDDALAAFLIGGGIAGMLLLTTFGLLFVRLRRLPKGEGGLAFRGIVSLATRLGYGPHPSQTEYEYASSLSETIPSVRDDLYLVADARVESAYGQREIGADRQVGLRRAYARIRTALLRLSLRLRR